MYAPFRIYSKIMIKICSKDFKFVFFLKEAKLMLEKTFEKKISEKFLIVFNFFCHFYDNFRIFLRIKFKFKFNFFIFS